MPPAHPGPLAPAFAAPDCSARSPLLLHPCRPAVALMLLPSVRSAPLLLLLHHCRLAEDAGEDLDEDELLLASMDAGLYTLQQCALVVGALWLLGDVGVRKRVVQLLHQKGHTLGLLREVLLEVRANVGEDGEPRQSCRRWWCCCCGCRLLRPLRLLLLLPPPPLVWGCRGWPATCAGHCRLFTAPV